MEHYSAKDIAKLSGINLSTVHVYASNGRIPRPYKNVTNNHGGHLKKYWLADDIDAWLKKFMAEKANQPVAIIRDNRAEMDEQKKTMSWVQMSKLWNIKSFTLRSHLCEKNKKLLQRDIDEYIVPTHWNIIVDVFPGLKMAI